MSFIDQLLSITTIIDRLENVGPSTKTDLKKRLKEKELPCSDRTFERAKKNIRDYFGIQLKYDDKAYSIIPTNKTGTERLHHLLGVIHELESFQEEISHPEINNRIIHEHYEPTEFLHWVPILTRAVLNQQRIKFTYFKISSEKEQEVSLKPYLLKQYRKHWYVIGEIDNGDIRVYAVDRIKEVEVLNDSFSFNKYEELNAKYYYRIGMYPGKELVDIMIKAHAPQHHYFKYMPLHHTQEIIQWENDHCILRLSLEINPELIQTLMMFANRIEVLSPTSLKEKLRENLSKSLQLNS